MASRDPEIFLRSEEIFSALSKIKGVNLSTYDQVILDSDPEVAPLMKQIDSDLQKMNEDISKMVKGEFKWGEEVLTDTWQYNLKEVAKCFVNLPQKFMVDIINLKSFKENVKPYHIRILLESSVEIFENQERMKNLEVISYIFEVWMRLHLMADANYLPRIDSKHIQLQDPFMRSQIREQNRKNQDFKKKYLSQDFNIKSFVLTFLEKLFIINKSRALGSGLRRLRLNILKMIKILFELGLWEIKELPDFLELIHAKLQLLFCEETEYGDDFEPDNNEMGSAYDPWYHENIACIISQSTMLHNDEAYKNVFNTKVNGRFVPAIDRVNDSIKRVYFNKKDSFNRMCFALFDGILHS